MRWFVIGLVAVLMAAVISVGVLDHFGFVNAGTMALSGMKHIKSFRPFVRTYELGLSRSKTLEQEWTKLNDAKEALTLEAQDVKRKESDLERQRTTTENELAQVEQKRDDALKAVKGAQQLDRAGKLCASMKPADAAKVLAGLNDYDVAQVLLRLSDQQAGTVLSAMDPRRAAKVLTLLVRQ